ncbi:hypothetical protein GEV33_004878 [Tenebrio molitor]|uniref:Centromere protein J C-terminal domain-containing protein n=1 Tax=Tenebrio molitor TaxID=7067 RepID=A0A8J6LFZ8_TENMO|nr:hypothetical protein GEV33_004878 [Tenebrio molitor]
MSLSPANILQRLNELKMWQESHEELLKKTKNLSNTSGNVTSASDYQTIEGLSAFDSTLNDENSLENMKNWESQVISPGKSFDQLLEEKLAQDPGPRTVAQKPKKPFLRKGAGLERFKLKPRQKPVRSRPKNNLNTSATPLRAPDLSVRPKATWCKIEEREDHIKKINELAQMDKCEVSEQTLYEKALEKELLIFEALEQKAENSSFCSTNSSVMRILSSTPSKIKPIAEEKRVHWESQSEEEDDVIETNLEREDIAEILLRLKSLAQNNARPNVPSIIEASEDEKWSSSEPSSDISISSIDLEETLKTEKRDVGVGTSEQPYGCAVCGDKLKRKIEEYEEKIQEVVEDKNRIVEIRKHLEQKERDFAKKKREFEDEKTNLVYELESERKKMIKEKQVFQTYVKDSQNRPNKRERQEISNLKQEVADLRETLKLKESKNGMTQARLRNQIKQLEKDNSNLKDEVERLTKENAKLSATQKLNRRPSDAKILHEINKNISKLTQETLRTKKCDQAEADKSERNKSSDKDDSLLETGTSHVDLETQYENTFRNQSPRETSTSTGKTEHTLEDGTKQIRYPNGNVKIVSPDGNQISVTFFNGDKQETNLIDGTVRYYFSERKICQTTYADGLELVEFPEGVTEKRYVDGRCEVMLPDGVVQTTFPDGSQETKYADGSIVNITKSGDKILLLPNGQKEIETKEYKVKSGVQAAVRIN